MKRLRQQLTHSNTWLFNKILAKRRQGIYRQTNARARCLAVQRFKKMNFLLNAKVSCPTKKFRFPLTVNVYCTFMVLNKF